MNIHSAIQDAIKKCNLVFFVGAGFSRSLGLPNWTELVEEITDKLKIDYPDDVIINNAGNLIRQGDYSEIEILDKLKQKGHLPRILEILEETINKVDLHPKALGRHEKLWQITDRVVTTNYDNALEKAAPAKYPTVVYEDDFRVANLSGMNRFLFKVHGSIEHPAKCVLFSDQYKKLYDGQTGATLELFNILSGKVIIFLGFSLNDPFVNELLDLRQRAYRGLKRNNFIITTDERDFSRFGVGRITSVSNYDSDLDQFLDELISLRQENPCGLGVLMQDLSNRGQEFDEENVRESYFNLLALFERKPETVAVAEDVRAGKFENAEAELRAKLQAELQTIQDSWEKAAEKAFELTALKRAQLQYNEALSYALQTVELDPGNSEYVNELGLVYHTLGQYYDAFENFKKALSLELNKQGDHRADIAVRHNNIATALQSLGKYAEAVQYYEKALAIDEEIYGSQNVGMMGLYANIGVAWQNLGEYERAMGYYEKAWTLNTEAKGLEDPDNAYILNNIGTLLWELKDGKTAIEYYKEALAINLKIYGDGHPRVSNGYNHIGTALDQLGKHNEAMEYLEKALAIEMKIYPEEHPSIAIAYSNIGSVFDNLHQYDKAVEYYERALDIDSKLFKADHPDIARDYINLGVAWKHAGVPEVAIELYDMALAINLKAEQPAAIATNYNNLGVAWSDLGEYGQAIGYFEKTLPIMIRIFGEDHPNTRKTIESLSLAQQNLNQR